MVDGRVGNRLATRSADAMHGNSPPGDLGEPSRQSVDTEPWVKRLGQLNVPICMARPSTVQCDRDTFEHIEGFFHWCENDRARTPTNFHDRLELMFILGTSDHAFRGAVALMREGVIDDDPPVTHEGAVDDTWVHYLARRGQESIVPVRPDPDGGITLQARFEVLGLEPDVLNTKNAKGETALLVALDSNEAVALALIAAGASPNVESSTYDTGSRHAWGLGRFDNDDAASIADAQYAEISSNREEAPLHMAARRGYADAVDALIGAGADIDATNSRGLTPLYVAAVNGRVSIIESLMHRGANPKLGPEGGTALHGATGISDRHFDGLLRLLACGADPNVPDDKGVTPLHIAAQFGLSIAARALIHKGAKLDAVTKDRNTPFELALKQGHADLAIELARIKQPALSQLRRWQVMAYAIESGNVERVRCLLDLGFDKEQLSPDGRSPLMLAMQAGHLDIVDELLARGVDVEHSTNFDDTAWEYAARGNDASAMMDRLASAGADIDRLDRDGRTALHRAVLQSDIATADLLLAKGADIDRCGANGTPLHVAVAHRRLDAIEWLLRHGADRSACDAHQRTPEQCIPRCPERQRIGYLLLQHPPTARP